MSAKKEEEEQSNLSDGQIEAARGALAEAEASKEIKRTAARLKSAKQMVLKKEQAAKLVAAREATQEQHDLACPVPAQLRGGLEKMAKLLNFDLNHVVAASMVMLAERCRAEGALACAQEVRACLRRTAR